MKLPKTQEMFFDGKTYEPDKDKIRLGSQAWAVFDCMVGETWWTLRQLADATKYPESSISARLRDFRKERFGAHAVERKKKDNGLFYYRLVPNNEIEID